MGQLSSYRAHIELIYEPHMRGLNMRTLSKAIVVDRYEVHAHQNIPQPNMLEPSAYSTQEELQ